MLELVRRYGSPLAVQNLDYSSDGVAHLDLGEGEEGGGKREGRSEQKTVT